jgi:predicted metal-dependent HD superfamily phosphohydrolase
MSHEAELRVAWRTYVGGTTDHCDRLLARHREPHRHYHGLAHVAWVVRHVAELAAAEPVDDHGALVAAAFYHDAVYDPTDSTNERASAQLARHELSVISEPSGSSGLSARSGLADPPAPTGEGPTWNDDRVATVVALIDGTAGHLDPPDHDAAVFYDADLAVLGADVPAYDAYVTGVRAEYAHLDDDQWRTGRATVLAGFLARPTIFATDEGRRRWERRARANLTAELTTLR